MQKRAIDRPFLVATLVLVFGGFFIFSSASLGLLAREGISLGGIMFNQALGLVLGLILMYVAARVPYQFWNKNALYILIGSIILTILVFIPHIGFSHGGATRWIDLGFGTFQPGEVLKLGFVVYFSAWLAGLREKVGDLRYSIVPFVTLLLIIGIILILQPDIGTFLIITGAGVILFVTGGGKWRHIASFVVVAGIALALIAILLPYARNRLITFVNPGDDPFGKSYQVQQSLIAVGSGQWFGRGFGQSVQKFNFLPEPVNDSIFAVFAEEWGFVGTTLFMLLLLFFIIRGYKIASVAPSMFSGLLVTGIVSLIAIQSLINIGSMLSIFPLTGVPLLFVSQGGTALMVTLLEAGIIMSVSRSQKSSKIA